MKNIRIISKVILGVAILATVSACSTGRFGTDHQDASLLIAARGPVEILNDTRYPHPPTESRIPDTLPEGVLLKK